MSWIKGIFSMSAQQSPKNQIDLNPGDLSARKFLQVKGFTQLASTPIPIPLIGGLVIVVSIVAYGLILLRQDPRAFAIWIREDGLAEWLTFFLLLGMSIYSFSVSSNFNQSRETRGARNVWLFMGALFLFGAMEEISWGQRIFGIQSPEWFLKHNAQLETNIHNLVLWGVKLNKLIFAKGLGICVVFYLFVVPSFYRVNAGMKRLIDRWGIPVAQNYQILLFIILAVAIRSHLGLSKKVEELLEFSGCYIFLLIIAHPYNLCYKKMRASRCKTSSTEKKGQGS
jgi:hypothetical protein